MSLFSYATLSDLNRLLNNQKIGGVFLVLSFVLMAGTLVLLLSIIIIPFTLYLLFVLYRYQKINWIIGFFVWMGISFLPIIFMSPGSALFIAFKFAPLLFFILYCMLLKEKTGAWLMDMDFERDTFFRKHSNGSENVS